jgi:hypothetical protein
MAGAGGIRRLVLTEAVPFFWTALVARDWACTDETIKETRIAATIRIDKFFMVYRE